jgi:hypothetical protein
MDNTYSLTYKGYNIIAIINPSKFFVTEYMYFDSKNKIEIKAHDLSWITYYIDVYKEDYLDDDRTREEYAKEAKEAYNGN